MLLTAGSSLRALLLTAGARYGWRQAQQARCAYWGSSDHTPVCLAEELSDLASGIVVAGHLKYQCLPVPLERHS
jgi:hypothetical protein